MSVFVQVKRGKFTNLRDLSRLQAYIRSITDKVGVYFECTLRVFSRIKLIMCHFLGIR